MKKKFEKIQVLVLALSGTSVLLLAPASRSQQTTSPPTPAQATDQADTSNRPFGDAKRTQNLDSTSRSGDYMPIPAVLVNDGLPPIRKVGSASLLDSASQSRWGDFFIGSADFSQVYATSSPVTGTSVGNNASLFRTHIYYDHQFQRGRLALQYQPRLMIIDGKVIGDFVNQNVNLDSYVVLSSRWVMGLDEHVTYYGSKNVYGDTFLDADSVTATTVQNNFLEGSGTWVSSSTGASFSYLWSPRMKIAISPSYTYSHSTSTLDNTQTGTFSSESFSSNGYSARATASYDMTESRSIGAYYYFQYLTSSNSFANTTYHGLGVSASQRITPSFAVNGSIGATTANFSGGRQWDSAFALGVIKSFQRSNVALSYSRGETLAGYVTNHLGERIDLRAVQGWTRRFQTGVGAGYQREISQPTGLWAKYVHGNMSYRLTAQLNLFSTYVHKWQKSSDPQLFSGGNDFVLFGIGWTPAPSTEIE
jgi:hypothetical protein